MSKAYSHTTSLPAYLENQTGKQQQKERIMNIIPTDGTCLKELEELTGLPQSTIAGRINDLKDEKKVMYWGFTTYAGRMRKRIVLYKELKQGELFQ